MDANAGGAARNVWCGAVILAACVYLLGGCRERPVRDPLTETNVPRPTNEAAELIPSVTNPPPR